MGVRKVYLLGFLICATALGAAHYVESQYMLATCPLCTLQRFIFWLLAIALLPGILFKITGIKKYIYNGLLLLLSLLGFAIAYRQMWLQYYAPPQQFSCAASFEHLIEVYPFLDALKVALKGSGECAEIDFTVLGISLAGWSVLIFGLFLIIMLYIMYLQKKRRI